MSSDKMCHRLEMSAQLLISLFYFWVDFGLLFSAKDLQYDVVKNCDIYILRADLAGQQLLMRI
ncbi:uncharacterized protein PRCAT00003960001 [Priceomyces carsonii]|uniref:uncharacterized protein n=1 Tax=Priceomyces carsonii TaxID=28549 RepID=UPI002EDAC6EF|nr:unnamed protein product [Priceomyces carsonii]